MRNYKTTLAGAGVILAAIGKAIGEYASGGIALVDFGTLLAAISGGAGLLVAKDFNVSGTKK